MPETPASPFGPVPGRGAAAAALSAMPRCGPTVLDTLLANSGPDGVWHQLVAGTPPCPGLPTDVVRAWYDYAAEVELDDIARTLARLECTVSAIGEPAHPVALAHDIDPAPVLFRRGREVEPTRPRVAIVGTRRCSPTGRELARELGAGLSGSGISVVSGLAVGVDGAAHRGALDVDGAPPIAVVGSGIDVPYPSANRDLWARVSERGTLLGEAPLGAPPERWRFPARNRLIAALADVVVVVESRAAGGSMITVEEAVRRGRPVMAVPGSVRNRAAAGTNQLIAEGCAPVCSVDDITTALGLVNAGPVPGLITDRAEPVPIDESALGALHETDRRILVALDHHGESLDRLARRHDLPIATAAVAATRLEQAGFAEIHDGRVRRRIVPGAPH